MNQLSKVFRVAKSKWSLNVENPVRGVVRPPKRKVADDLLTMEHRAEVDAVFRYVLAVEPDNLGALILMG
jgi:hypothetical protein